jgi:hypothetical protein
MYNGNKFKNEVGAHLLKPIFFEYDNSEHNYTIYTLKDRDHTWQGKVYPSLRKIYVEMEDPTEYDFACQHLDGWMHWKKLSESSFFQEYLKEWREELEVRMRAKALNRIKTRAASADKDSFAADKILLAGGWKTTEDKQKVGRPSKEKIQQEAEKLFSAATEFDEDFKRLNIN